MLPTRVALVPYEAASPPEPDDLLRVAAALQIQVERDLRPLWGVAAIVSPFLALEQVPPGYLPLVIVNRKLQLGFHGLHFTDDGRPFALVEHNANWSLTASHELLEMLVDPFGMRGAPGQSLHEQQGEVEYLVEVCDPCQHTTYTIDGVLVSDFITPHYYDPFTTQGARYSYTGAVARPRQLLPGGYISWRVRGWPIDSIWQAFQPEGREEAGDHDVTGEKPEVREVSVPGARLSREWVDAHHADDVPQPPRRLRPGTPPLEPAQRAYELGTDSAKRYGAIVRAEIASLLPPPPDRAKLMDLLEKLASDDKAREKFRKNPGPDLRRLKLDVPADLGPLPPLPPKESYRALRDAVEDGDRFGVPAVDQPGFGSFLCSLGGF